MDGWRMGKNGRHRQEIDAKDNRPSEVNRRTSSHYLCEVESIVNSWPITTIGDQDLPCEALQPIDFIYKDDDHGRIYEADHSALIDLTISASAVYRADSIIDDENCDFTSSPLQGCYNCLRGADVVSSCYSNQPIMIEVKCQRNLFAATCNSSTAQTTAIIQATRPKYEDICDVKCGRKSHKVVISEISAFHTLWETPTHLRKDEHANYVNMFNFPDSEHLIDITIGHWTIVDSSGRTILAMIAIAIFITAIVLTSKKLIV
ncbi:hypothetical protein V3C99_018533 [Haemonchus contortus]|uniref:Gnk2-homologous domain-containing protein n=1 Tax=Haemonchus contortus TaxID=6289 RepID=A0A7I4Z4L2_HAECO